MHFGYALMVGVGVAVLSRSAVAQLAGIAYPGVVLLAITATGNHFVLDAAAGAAVMGLGLGGVAVARRVRRLPAPAAAVESRIDRSLSV
jgi:hypothetical protein